MAKRKVLEGEVTVRSPKGQQGAEGDQEQPKHPAGYQRQIPHQGPLVFGSHFAAIQDQLTTVVPDEEEDVEDL